MCKLKTAMIQSCVSVSHILYAIQLIACPLCDATSSTISEDIVASEIAVIGKSVGTETPIGVVDLPMTRFQIIEKLKVANANLELTDLLTAEQKVYSNSPIATDEKFLLFAYETTSIEWGVPLPLSPIADRYVRELSKLPPEGVERLRFYVSHIESPDDLVSEDSYNEFAKTSMDSIRSIRDNLDRKRLIAMIKSPDIKPRLRGLCWMLLSLVGKSEDVSFCRNTLFRINVSETTPPIDLPANIACMVSLGGEKAMTEIDDRFLRSQSASTSAVNAVVSAIRVLEQELHAISKERLSASLRLVLEREDMADYVIPDLARWEDWSAMERLDRLFYESDTDRSFVRIPIFNYMRICPRPEAKQLLKKMESADFLSAQRAAMLFGYKSLEPEPK